MRRAAIVLALALTACGDPPPQTTEVQEAFIVHRLHVHPATVLAEWAGNNSETGMSLETAFDLFSCDGAASLVARFDAAIGGGGGLGEMQLLIATPSTAGDPCRGEAGMLVQDVSYIDPDADPPVAQVSGPLVFEGRSLDARINLGDFGVAGASLEDFPRWWNVTAEVDGFDPDTGEVVPSGLRVVDAEARAVWTLRQIGDTVTEDTMIPALVQLTAGGVEPDVDVDGDGLERVIMEDGDIVGCRDGDGALIDGPTCYRDPRIADGFDTRLVFRLVRITDLEL